MWTIHYRKQTPNNMEEQLCLKMFYYNVFFYSSILRTVCIIGLFSLRCSSDDLQNGLLFLYIHTKGGKKIYFRNDLFSKITRLWWLIFYGHFCAHGRLNGLSDLQQ